MTTTTKASKLWLVLGLALATFSCSSPSDDNAVDADARHDGKVGRFQASNRFAMEVPAGARRVRVWFPLPSQDHATQSISNEVVDAGGLPFEITEDELGNRFVYVELMDPTQTSIAINTSFGVRRAEDIHVVDPGRTRPPTTGELADKNRWLRPSTNVTMGPEISSLAAQITRGEKNPVRAARLLYDWVLHNVDYWVKDPANKKASPVGSTDYCFSSRTGNCTDFHSLWTSLARASGIPTRMMYGSLFKPALDGVDKDGSYHCWPEFWAPNLGWIPHDVAIADLFVDRFPIGESNETLVNLTTAYGYGGPDAAMVDYYFGSLDERRVTWAMGRDLALVPRQDDGPVNAAPKGYVEVDGKSHSKFTRTFTYTRAQ